MLNQTSHKGVCPKLYPPWKGPAVVLEVLTPYLYRVQHGRQVSVVNLDKLRLRRDKWNALPAWVRRVFSPPEGTGGEQFYIYKLPDDGELVIQCDECLN